MFALHCARPIASFPVALFSLRLALQNKATGLVLQIGGQSEARKVLVVCDAFAPGVKSQIWRPNADRQIISEVNGMMLTIRNGSTKTRGEVWCNRRNVLQGVTKAQKWSFVRYDGEPKNPSYPINEKHRHLLAAGVTVDYGPPKAKRRASTLDARK